MAVSRGRVRRATIEAENLLHDLGAIPIINSDSMGMGRIGELVRRTWQLASRRLADTARPRRPAHRKAGPRRRPPRGSTARTTNACCGTWPS